MKYYTGIGSRKTPNDVCTLMTKLALILYKYNFILRSGHADGADIAFENGAYNKKEIYIPWKNFNGSNSTLYNIPNKAFEMAKHIHPTWDRCNIYVKKLHARNICQVLGQDFKTSSKFVICWTPNAKIIGGTATAINLAKQHNISVFNLANNNIKNKIIEYIKKNQ